MNLRAEGLLLPADSPRRWPEPAVHTRDDDFPNLCAGKTDRSTAPRCSRYMFQWPFDRNSNNSTGRTTNIPISINLVSRGRDPLGQHQESRPLGEIGRVTAVTLSTHVQKPFILNLNACARSNWNQDFLVSICQIVQIETKGILDVCMQAKVTQT